jgi:hypothetical protein
MDVVVAVPPLGAIGGVQSYSITASGLGAAADRLRSPLDRG